MSIIIGILLVLFVILAILLVLIILAQDDGTEGAGIIFGSAASQQYGARKGNIITRTTGILATLFVSIAFILSFLFQHNATDLDITDAAVTSEETSLEWWNVDDSNQQDIPLEVPVDASSTPPPTENVDTKNSETSQDISNTSVESLEIESQVIETSEEDTPPIDNNTSNKE